MTDSDWSLIERALEHVYAGSVGDEATQIRTDALAVLGRLREQAESVEKERDTARLLLSDTTKRLEFLTLENGRMREGHLMDLHAGVAERIETLEARAERAETEHGDECYLARRAGEALSEALEARDRLRAALVDHHPCPSRCGTGCHNCRGTGYSQTPCLICAAAPGVSVAAKGAE